MCHCIPLFCVDRTWGPVGLYRFTDLKVSSAEYRGLSTPAVPVFSCLFRSISLIVGSTPDCAVTGSCAFACGGMTIPFHLESSPRVARWEREATAWTHRASKLRRLLP